jgi:Kef-type K+ transport system membrane component KefB/mannitol/fructose-specific phosphotransferase system IIA component (Ntr-type)
MKKTLVFLFCLTAAATARAQNADAAHAFDMGERMMYLVMQLGTILVAARFGNMLAERLRLPGVLGELLAGVAVGPFLLGHLALPGFPEGLFPVVGGNTLSPELYGICTVASLVLLFNVGLETDVKLFLRYSAVGSLVGVGGVLLSFFSGNLLVVLLSPLLFGATYHWLDPMPLFMGIIATATSVGITARILSEQQKIDSPEGSTIMAAAVVDDVLGIVLLAVGLGVAGASLNGGMDWLHVGGIALKALGIWLVATAIGLRASQKIGFLLKCFGDRSAIAALALGLALILAGLFEGVGLAMIIGAYVAGLSLSGTDISRVIREKTEPVQNLLVPVFFAGMGALVNLHRMASVSTLAFGFAFVLIVGLAKLAGCGIPAHLFGGFNKLGAFRIGAGMLPRGEVTLIMAGVGLTVGALDERLFSVVVLMVLVTSLLAPPLLSLAFSGSRTGTDRNRHDDRDTSARFDFPSDSMAELLTAKLLRAFEAEGFFVHTLGRQKLFQFRKNKTVIGLARDRSELVFTCGKSDLPFINTAMYEVVAEFEQTLRDLRRPLDIAAIGKKLQSGAASVVAQPALMRYIPPDAVTAALQGADKASIIDELLDLLHAKGYVGDRQQAREDIWAREKSLSTGMQFGIAIPHGRTDAVKRLVCAIGVKRDGCDFDSIDGQPTRIVVLTLSPKHLTAPHMQFMAMISQALDEEGRARILRADNAAELWAAIAHK